MAEEGGQGQQGHEGHEGHGGREGREGRGVLLYLLLDVGSDDEARRLADTLGGAMAEVDERFVGYALSEVEPVRLTFQPEAAESAGEGAPDLPSTERPGAAADGAASAPVPAAPEAPVNERPRGGRDRDRDRDRRPDR